MQRGDNVCDTVHAGRDLSPAEPESPQQVIVHLGVRGESLGLPCVIILSHWDHGQDCVGPFRNLEIFGLVSTVLNTLSCAP